MNSYRRLFQTVAGSITVIGTALYINDLKNTEKLKASWTTSYEPSVKWDFNWDRRDPASLKKPSKRHSLDSSKPNNDQTGAESKTQDDIELGRAKSKASRHLYLIRHGQYHIEASDPEKMFLTDLGREQAKYTGVRLLERSMKFNYTKLHHSTMVRAVETADIIRKELPDSIQVSVDPLLCEGAPIPPEPPVGHWKPEVYFFQDGSRIEAAFRKYFYRAPPEQLEDTHEIIVCHANVIRYFFCRSLQFPAEAWLRFSLSHGSITHIVIRPDGRVSCHVLGENGYQPVPKISY